MTIAENQNDVQVFNFFFNEEIFTFKINSSVITDRTKNQWIDLGIHTEACMTRPETCGAAGGAISLWLKVINCSDDGIITTRSDRNSTGSIVFCRNDKIG